MRGEIVDKRLTLKGDPGAVEAVGCFDPAPSRPGHLDSIEYAILDGDGSTA